jgi:hypothetical protein
MRLRRSSSKCGHTRRRAGYPHRRPAAVSLSSATSSAFVLSSGSSRTISAIADRRPPPGQQEQLERLEAETLGEPAQDLERREPFAALDVRKREPRELRLGLVGELGEAQPAFLAQRPDPLAEPPRERGGIEIFVGIGHLLKVAKGLRYVLSSSQQREWREDRACLTPTTSHGSAAFPFCSRRAEPAARRSPTPRPASMERPAIPTGHATPDSCACRISASGRPDARPDAPAADRGGPDAQGPDAAVPDSAKPDSPRPDVAKPDTAAPDPPQRSRDPSGFASHENT